MQKLNFNCFISMFFHDSMEQKQGCGCQKQGRLEIYIPFTKPLELRLPDFTLRAGPGPACQHCRDFHTKNAIILAVTGILGGWILRYHCFRPCAKLLIWNFPKSVKLLCLQFSCFQSWNLTDFCYVNNAEGIHFFWYKEYLVQTPKALPILTPSQIMTGKN